MSIIVRFPPSPTGLFHVGTARTVLYNFLFAKKNGGKCIMRLEDTDKERSEKFFEENILSGIQKLGMGWDGEVFHQSERTEIYKNFLHQLIDEKKAYFCFATEQELTQLREDAEKAKKAFRYPNIWRDADEKIVAEKLANGEKFVIRFRIPDETHDIIFSDSVRGEVKIHAKELDDFVIAKNFDTPLYNFCVVVDDADMKISHVIRGEDHISNTPKQILLFEAFGWKIPQFAHLPLILNADRSKLSKRKNKVSVDDFLADGILPEALINFLALLGWNTGTEQEIFSMQELIENFSLERIHKAGAIFDAEKLLWVNSQWIRKKSVEEFFVLAKPFLPENFLALPENFQKNALALVQERTRKLSELPDFVRFFAIEDEKISYDKNLFTHAKMGTSPENATESLQFSLKILENFVGECGKEFSVENLKNLFMEKIKEAGLKNGFVLFPLRVALSGEEFSPGTFELLEIFGKERSIQRVQRALEIVCSMEK